MTYGWRGNAFIISVDDDKEQVLLTKEDVKHLLKAIQDKKEYPWNPWMERKPAKKRR